MYELKKVHFKETLSVVIPLYNKESNIESTLKQVIDYIGSPDLQIIVVENGSTDSSKQIAEECIKNFSDENNITLYSSDKGLGNALIEGFKHCKNEWVYFIPADFSFGNSELLFIEENNLYKTHHLFIGSKTHSDSKIVRSKSRKLYSLIFNSLLKIMFSIPFNDTQGTIIFKSDILDDIGVLRNQEFLITTEFIVKAYKLKKSILEIPIVDLGIDTVSTVKPIVDGFKMLISIIKLKFQIN
tara:strand:- start:10377 stop:11102 length:726 start_codon:yes stop_codon:yes gene_type:complete